MARIAIYIGRHLCTAPRPCKEATALAAAGHEVTVCGLWFDPRLIARDQILLKRVPWVFEPYADCSPSSRSNRWRWFRLRLRHRLGRECLVRTGLAMPDVFGYGTKALATDAWRRHADLSIFHSEGGLWTACRLRRRGRVVGMDFEDWFSRDLSTEERVGRPVAALTRLEHAALHFGPYVLATSRAMAQALAATYSAPEPAVIYNSFPAAPAADAPRTPIIPARDYVSLHWFSQVLGPNRGLETLFAALPLLTPPWQLHIRADDPSSFAMRLRSRLPEALRPRVWFHPTVLPAELPYRVAEHDVGLALEPSAPTNKNLTVSNKLFQYLQAGLAVVASDTAGQREVLEQAPAAGEVFSAGEPHSLAEALNRIMQADRLATAKRAARQASQNIFSHERQVAKYAELAERALPRS